MNNLAYVHVREQAPIDGDPRYPCRMSRMPGRRTDEPDDEAMRAVEGLELRDIGQSFIELGEQLKMIGGLTEKQRFDLQREAYESSLHGFELEQAELDRQDEVRDAMTKTLTGLRMFRGNYDYWERVAAEYALDKLNFTQRRTATLLGVGLSTINRWAQNPVATEENEEQ
jgi:hypothetical protein